MTNRKEPADKNALAEDRTDLAEDRTLLANERTFSGWARTAMASIGIGIGFNALFAKVEPSWVAKAIATMFLLLAVFLVVTAERRACGVHARLSPHTISNVATINFKVIAVAISVGAIALGVAIWWFT